MFESIAILPNTARKHPLDIGDLAEKMLYYKNVRVFANKKELLTLFNYFEIDLLIEYLKRGYLEIINRKKIYGVGLQGGSYIADFMYDTNYDLKKIIYEAYYEFSGDHEKSKKVADLLYKYVGIFDTPSGFAHEVNKDLADPLFTKKSIIKNIGYYHPHDNVNIGDFEFHVEPQADGRLIIDTNIDTEKYPFLDPSSIILNIGNAIEDTKIAANYNTELSVPELNSSIISVKINSLIAKAAKSESEIDVFKHVQLPDAPSLQEIINDRHKSMAEYLEVLEKGERFKSWLNDLGEDNKLIKEYIAKVNERSWIQSAPAKAIRFYLVQGVSTILKATGTLGGIAAGIGLSAANTFLVDKLGKGWKPNHFIENQVIPFMEVDGETGKVADK